MPKALKKQKKSCPALVKLGAFKIINILLIFFAYADAAPASSGK